VSGNVGLLFTNRPHAAVMLFFETYGVPDFARSGFVPASTVAVPPGPLPTDAWPHTQADTLAKLGARVRLNRATIVVEEPIVLCTEGVPITPEQGRLLQLFGHALAVFRLHPVGVWEKGTEKGTGKEHKARGGGGAGAGADGGGGGEYRRLAQSAAEAALAKYGGLGAGVPRKKTTKAGAGGKARGVRAYAAGAGGGGDDDDDEDDEDEEEEEEEDDE
jgi:hypothetical protein